MEYVVSLKNIYKKFGDKEVLKNVSLDIAVGESIVIIGGSGTGKSVLLKILLGLLQPDSGEVYINGVLTNNLSLNKRFKVNKDIAMLFQGGALFDSLNIAENICFELSLNHNFSKSEILEIATNNLKKVGLDETILKLYPPSLSGGMQKRVALARALSVNPKLILFDEPTTGLDPIMSNLINDLISSNIKEMQDSTSITITHDMGSAKKIASRVLMLYKGEFIFDGNFNEILMNTNEIVSQFVRGES
jgi:phospholipid/cholesterol/gamma-HCH transport system ATP-binding protein